MSLSCMQMFDKVPEKPSVKSCTGCAMWSSYSHLAISTIWPGLGKQRRSSCPWDGGPKMTNQASSGDDHSCQRMLTHSTPQKKSAACLLGCFCHDLTGPSGAWGSPHQSPDVRGPALCHCHWKKHEMQGAAPGCPQASKPQGIPWDCQTLASAYVAHCSATIIC